MVGFYRLYWCVRACACCKWPATVQYSIAVFPLQLLSFYLYLPFFPLPSPLPYRSPSIARSPSLYLTSKFTADKRLYEHVRNIGILPGWIFLSLLPSCNLQLWIATEHCSNVMGEHCFFGGRTQNICALFILFSFNYIIRAFIWKFRKYFYFQKLLRHETVQLIMFFFLQQNDLCE